MSPDPSAGTENTPDTGPPDRKRRADRASLAPTLAVLAVAGAAVAAAFMGTQPDAPNAQSAAVAPAPRQEVVRAPPLVVKAPPLKPVKPAAPGGQQGSELRGATRAMGAAPACNECGVVETVVAARPGEGFQMRIRMDDGSLRTVEQRGALAAGTRVVVNGASVRLAG
ncbi:MAG: hypothetical protein Q8R01_17470 [Ramlibacter sp.]|nr:hypothetical protein [Ramlibacter sp.]